MRSSFGDRSNKPFGNSLSWRHDIASEAHAHDLSIDPSRETLHQVS
jgi:hypothetical protein